MTLHCIVTVNNINAYNFLGVCAIHTIDINNAYINTFITDEKYRGIGFGKKVFNYALNSACGKNIYVTGSSKTSRLSHDVILCNDVIKIQGN